MHYLLANGENMCIREAAAEDAAALLSFFREIVKDTGFLMTTPEEAEQIKESEEYLYIKTYSQRRNSVLWVATVGQKIVGDLTLRQHQKKKQRHIVALGVNVLADYWNMGIARRLMNVMLNLLEKKPEIYCIHLKVQAINETAIRLFRQFGFKEEGRRKAAVRLEAGMYEDLILMGKWIGKKESE